MTSGVGAEREMAEKQRNSTPATDSHVPMLRGCLSIVGGPRRGFAALGGIRRGGVERTRRREGGRDIVAERSSVSCSPRNASVVGARNSCALCMCSAACQ